MLLNKGTIEKLGSRMNDAAASKPSNFAMRQMQRMGWVEGKGLGKNEDGIASNISIKKREENSGLGSEAVKKEALQATENWWHDAFSSNLQLMASKMSKGKGKKKDKSKRTKKRSDGNQEDDGDEQMLLGGSPSSPFGDKSETAGKKSRKNGIFKSISNSAPPTFEELFAATGGVRLGMRARAEQRGKLKRTEECEMKTQTNPSSSSSSSTVSAEIKSSTTTSSTTSSLEMKIDTESILPATSSSSKGKKRNDKNRKKDKKEKKVKKEKNGARDAGSSEYAAAETQVLLRVDQNRSDRRSNQADLEGNLVIEDRAAVAGIAGGGEVKKKKRKMNDLSVVAEVADGVVSDPNLCGDREGAEGVVEVKKNKKRKKSEKTNER